MQRTASMSSAGSGSTGFTNNSAFSGKAGLIVRGAWSRGLCTALLHL